MRCPRFDDRRGHPRSASSYRPSPSRRWSGSAIPVRRGDASAASRDACTSKRCDCRDRGFRDTARRPARVEDQAGVGAGAALLLTRRENVSTRRSSPSEAIDSIEFHDTPRVGLPAARTRSLRSTALGTRANPRGAATRPSRFAAGSTSRQFPPTRARAADVYDTHTALGALPRPPPLPRASPQPISLYRRAPRATRWRTRVPAAGRLASCTTRIASATRMRISSSGTR